MVTFFLTMATVSGDLSFVEMLKYPGYMPSAAGLIISTIVKYTKLVSYLKLDSQVNGLQDELRSLQREKEHLMDSMNNENESKKGVR